MRILQRTTFPKSGKRPEAKRSFRSARERGLVYIKNSPDLKTTPGTWEKDGITCNGLEIRERITGFPVARIYYQDFGEQAQIRFRKTAKVYRGLGIGTVLLDMLEGQLRRKGKKEIFAKTRQPETAIFFIGNGYAIKEMKNAKVPKEKNAQIRLLKEAIANARKHLSQMTLTKKL